IGLMLVFGSQHFFINHRGFCTDAVLMFFHHLPPRCATECQQQTDQNGRNILAGQVFQLLDLFLLSQVFSHDDITPLCNGSARKRTVSKNSTLFSVRCGRSSRRDLMVMVLSAISCSPSTSANRAPLRSALRN